MWWGRTIIERDGDLSRERGRALLPEAEAAARALGLVAIRNEASKLLARA